MLTPKDIQEVEFRNSFRGYNKKEVDEFLDKITIDYQNALDEISRLTGENQTLQTEIEDQKRSENSVMNTLEQAKRLMSDISESAEKRAEIIIKNARLDAAAITRNAKDSVASYTDEAEVLKRRVTKFREKFRALLNEELLHVDQSVDDLFRDLRSGDAEPEAEAEAAPAPEVTEAPSPAEKLFAAEEPKAEPADADAAKTRIMPAIGAKTEETAPDLDKTIVMRRESSTAEAMREFRSQAEALEAKRDDILSRIDAELAKEFSSEKE